MDGLGPQPGHPATIFAGIIADCQGRVRCLCRNSGFSGRHSLSICPSEKSRFPGERSALHRGTEVQSVSGQTGSSVKTWNTGEFHIRATGNEAIHGMASAPHLRDVEPGSALVARAGAPEDALTFVICLSSFRHMNGTCCATGLMSSSLRRLPLCDFGTSVDDV